MSGIESFEKKRIRSYAVERELGGDRDSANPITEFRNSGKIGAYIFL